MPIDVRQGALSITGTGLFLDSRRRAPLCFVSHAHTDHIARHDRTIATKETLAFMAHRLGALEETVALDYGVPLVTDGLQLELFSAGHVLGSAQVRVTRGDGHRIVYTGDLSLGASLTAPPAEIVACDTLVIESTFGNARYVFPPREQVYDEVTAWARALLARGTRPVLLAYSLGKGQETIAQLAQRGLQVAAHESIFAMSQLYSSLGVPIPVRKFEGTFAPMEVGVFPPRGTREALAAAGPYSTAVLTGWALEPWGARRYGADVAFPISDHADFPSLVRYAQGCGAREIVTVHGYADELAKAFKKLGLFARAITERVQMELSL